MKRLLWIVLAAMMLLPALAAAEDAVEARYPGYSGIWEATTDKSSYAISDGKIVVSYEVVYDTNPADIGAYYVGCKLVNVADGRSYAEASEFFTGKTGSYSLSIPLSDSIPSGVYNVELNTWSGTKEPTSGDPIKVTVQITNSGASAPTPAPAVTTNAFKNVKVSSTAINADDKSIRVTGDLEAVDTAEIRISIMKIADENGNTIYDVVTSESFSRVKSGPFTWEWNLLDMAGRRVQNGKYEIEVQALDSFSWETFYGNTFAVSVGAEPKISSAALGAETYYIEYSVEPKITVAATPGTVSVQVLAPSGKAIRTLTKKVSANVKTDIFWDLKDSGGKVVSAAGNYSFKVSVKGDVGESKAVTRSFALKKRPALTLSVTANDASFAVNPWVKAKFTIKANQGCKYKIETINGSGKVVETINATAEKNVTYNMTPMVDGKYYAAGSYTLKVTATSLTGEKKTASAKFTCTAAKKVSISSAKLSKSSLYAGDALSFTCKTNTKSNIYLYVLNGSGKTVVSLSSALTKDAGEQTVNIATASLAAGQYTAVFTAETGNNTAKAQKVFTVKKKATADKMKISGLQAEMVDDNVGGFYFYVNYVGVGTLHLEIRNSSNTLVYTTSLAVSGGSNWTVDWPLITTDWQSVPAGKYTVTAYGVNAGGTSNKETVTINVS